MADETTVSLSEEELLQLAGRIGDTHSVPTAMALRVLNQGLRLYAQVAQLEQDGKEKNAFIQHLCTRLSEAEAYLTRQVVYTDKLEGIIKQIADFARQASDLDGAVESRRDKFRVHVAKDGWNSGQEKGEKDDAAGSTGPGGTGR